MGIAPVSLRSCVVIALDSCLFHWFTLLRQFAMNMQLLSSNFRPSRVYESSRQSLVVGRCWTVLTAIALVVSVLLSSPATAQGVVAEAPQSIADLRAIEQQVDEVIKQVMPAVVGVRVGASQGSAVIVSSDGFVLTAGHVVGKPNQDVTFIFPDGKTAKGKTLGMNTEVDAGMMKITSDPPEGGWPHVEMGDSEHVPEGAWVVAMGHPLGYTKGRPPVVRLGRVLRNHDTVIRTDCPLVAGDSGGPVFDLEGKVVAINSRIAGSTSMNYHVPVNLFRNGWDRLAKGDVWSDALPGRDSKPVESVVEPIAQNGLKWTAQVLCDGKVVSLGTIVGPDGWITTKASELKGPAKCKLPDGRELPAEVVGIHEQFDVAMLKIDVHGLPPIPWAGDQDPPPGHWVVCPISDPERKDDHVTLGVIGAPRRAIPRQPGVLGISLQDTKEGPKIARIVDKSGAADAGLKVGDIIIAVDGKKTPKAADVVAAIRVHRPKEQVNMTIRRGGKNTDITAVLKPIQTPGTQKRDMQNRSGVGISNRRDGFPVVLQHDSVIPPDQCGGPVMNLDGKVIGMNIARGGRTETYLIPRDVLLGMMYDLMSGRLRPAAPPEQAASEKATEEKDEGGNEKPPAEKEKTPEKQETPKSPQSPGKPEKESAPKPQAEQPKEQPREKPSEEDKQPDSPPDAAPNSQPEPKSPEPPKAEEDRP
ncbi:MAG: PDZ domain-containing protein, partial [Planctomycetota bacterium]